jgi:hypothetical protein
MKCASPYPDGSYQECQLLLNHPGQHTYPGLKWPRLEPAEMDPDIADLLAETMPPRTYGVDERSFPVVVVETTTRIVWVDAETEDEALAYWADDYCDLHLDNANVLNSDLEFERPDRFQREDAMASAGHGRRKVGPEIACPGCGHLAFEREWFHDPFRKCHGPIEWRTTLRGHQLRNYRSTPVHNARQQVAA